ncbi:MAG: VWA domain-containing protein [Terriglobales bacterium]
MPRWFGCAFLCVFTVVSGAAAQIRVSGGAYTLSPPDVQAQQRLIPVAAVVRAGDGGLIPNLARDNFQVIEDGHVLPLVQFSQYRASGPRYIALFFDDLNSSAADLSAARSAVLAWVRRGRKQGDEVGVFTASGAVRVAYTGDATALIQAIASVRAVPAAKLLEACPRIVPYEAYRIVAERNAEAVEQAMMDNARCNNPYSVKSGVRVDPRATFFIRQMAQTRWDDARTRSARTQAALSEVLGELANLPGQRVLLLASAGIISTTLEGGQQNLLDQAVSGRVAMDAFEAGGGQHYRSSGGRKFETASLVALAQATGGSFRESAGPLVLGAAPALVYEMAFAPTALPHDAKFHPLQVDLAPPIAGASVQARAGYYDPDPETRAERLAPALASAMRGSARRDEVPAKINVEQRASGLAVDVHCDVARLGLVLANGRRRQLLVLIAGLFVPDGGYVPGERVMLNLALDSSHYKYFRAHGLGATLKLAAPTGSYRLRVVVGEASDGRISAFTRAVTVH